MDNKKISKFLSYILRHNPSSIVLELDEHGWANIDDIIKRSSFPLTKEMIESVVQTNDKQRFKIEGDKIRASQGHSLEVDLELKEKKPPEYLFHGTVQNKMGLIWEQGLKKMNRQHVQLSDSIVDAGIVGRRHGRDVVILQVNSGMMYRDGFKFYLSDNNIWLIEHIPPEFLYLLN